MTAVLDSSLLVLVMLACKHAEFLDTQRPLQLSFHVSTGQSVAVRQMQYGRVLSEQSDVHTQAAATAHHAAV